MKKGKEKKFYLVKILISILLGFLPSFIFVVLLIQYGNPFINYIKFLSNFDSSLGAWISGLLLSLFAYFLIGIIGSKNLFKKMLKNKFLFVFVVFCFVIAFCLMAVQLYLYTNFVLRNDILVELSSDKEDIFFTDNSEEDVTFNIDLIMNPFCSAYCEYEFLDISSGEIIEKGFFSTTVLSKKRSYVLENKDLVEGSQELKEFEISCKSEKTLFCYTSERESKRKVLLTVNYQLTENEKEFKNNSRKDIEEISNVLYSFGNKLTEFFENFDLMKNYFYNEGFDNKSKSLKESYESANVFLENAISLWKEQSFDELDGILELKNKSENLSNEIGKLRNDIFSNISFYNNLVGNLIISRERLSYLSNLSFESSGCDALNKLISDYNSAVINFKDSFSLEDKAIISEMIFNQVNEFNYTNVSGELCSLDEEITRGNLTKLDIVYLDFPFLNFSLDDPEPVCYFNGDCEKCLGDESSDKNYPVLFLHGQSINEYISVGYSFDAFSEIKEKLVEEGYVDAGSIVLSSTTKGGLWGKINSTMIMTGSYFFDTYKTENQEVTVSSNKEGIDTYAIRLKKLIELVKFKTNKNKVIIASHSMGGVVTRKYIQLFGGDDIDKAILVSSPNHGVEDKIRDYCAVIGPEASCNDLDKDGIFMKNLNNNLREEIPIYNIIGIGCNMGDDTGDGVIKNSSQYLEFAENYYFKGICDEINFKFFHESILFPELYPKVYDKIYEIINEELI